MCPSADTYDRETSITSNQVSIPETNVTIYQALYGRRMAWKFKDELVPREKVERMLDVAAWAPNHRLTEPWRFFVLEKASPARRKAAELAYDFALEHSDTPARALAARHKVLDPPLVVYVYCVPGPNENVTRENYAAVCCAIQNICLAGVAEGVAVAWETGGPTRHADLKAALGAAEDWIMAAMLSVGVPAATSVARRTRVSNFVKWSEDGDQ
jgi:nitroreductase